MSLASFLKQAKPSLFAGIADAGDASEKLYAPCTIRDTPDKAEAKHLVRRLGVVRAGQHEVWLTIWDADSAEINAVEQYVRVGDRWAAGDSSSGSERRYGRSDGSLEFLFRDDGTATLVFRQAGRTTALGAAEFTRALDTLWAEMISMLSQVPRRIRAHSRLRAGSAEPTAPDPATSAAPARLEQVSGPPAEEHPTDPDEVMARIALERRLVTHAQLKEARAVRRKAADLGLFESLLPILTARGIVSADVAQELASAVSVATGDARLIAGYEVTAKLGQGGMGAVYKATRLKTGEVVALKLLPPSLADDVTIARFRLEAQTVSTFAHANIVSFVEFGYDRGKDVYFCALEYVEGEDLATRILRTKMLPEYEAIDIARRVAMALQHAHFHGMVHRDVKPANIMLAVDGTVKLLDLGLARSTHAAASRVTQMGAFVGTPHYVSPEQACARDVIDIRSDMYSLGATLYHALTGRPPFDGPNAITILQQHVTAMLPWPAHLREDLSDGVCVLIAKLMAKDPDDRYQIPTELLADLDALSAGEGPSVSEDVMRCSSTQMAAKPRRKSRRRHLSSRTRARSRQTARGGLRPASRVRPASEARVKAAERAEPEAEFTPPAAGATYPVDRSEPAPLADAKAGPTTCKTPRMTVAPTPTAPAVAELRAYWRGLPPQTRIAVAVGASVLALIAVLFLAAVLATGAQPPAAAAPPAVVRVEPELPDAPAEQPRTADTALSAVRAYELAHPDDIGGCIAGYEGVVMRYPSSWQAREARLRITALRTRLTSPPASPAEADAGAKP